MRLRWVIILVLISLFPAGVFAAGSPTFTVAPAKIEISLKPGEQAIRNITIKNNLAKDALFKVSVEDVGATTSQALALYGDQDGPYSIRHLLTLSDQSVFLRQGEERTVSIVISTPTGSALGGRYGAVLFAVEADSVGGSGVAKVISRLGTLIFVKVIGKEVPSGSVASFGILGDHVRFKADREPLVAQISYQNNGNVHLNPYGEVIVKNILTGRLVIKKVDPWFVLPGAIKLREIPLGDSFAIGLYQITANVYSGYANKLEKATAIVWYLPSPLVIILILVGSIGLIALVVIQLKRKYHG